MSDSGEKAGVDSSSFGYRLGSWWRRHPVGRWVAVGAVALLVAVALFGPGAPNKSSDTIAVPASASDLKGEDYQDVVTRLKTAGFTSIETTSIDDLITGWLTKDGEVERVSVDGTTDFGANSSFPKGAKIVVTYHTFPTESPDAAVPKESSDAAVESSTAPEPAPVVEPTVSDAESNYVSDVVPISEDMSTALGELSTLMTDDPVAVFTDADTRMNIAVQMATIKTGYPRTKKLNPPPRFRTVHADLLAAMKLYDQAMNKLAQGIDDVDAAKVNAATALMTKGANKMSSATSRVQALTGQ